MVAKSTRHEAGRKFNKTRCTGTLALHFHWLSYVNDFHRHSQPEQNWQPAAVATTRRPEDSLPRYVLRVVGVCLMFALFGLGCILLAIWAGVLRLAVSDERRRVRLLRRHLSALSAGWIEIAIRSGGMSLPVETFEPAGLSGTEEAVDNNCSAKAKGTLIVANHPTIMDVILLWSRFPNAGYVMKADIRKVPLLRPLIRPLDYLSNSDPEQLLIEATTRLVAGETLVVFPEATRTMPGEPMTFRLGAAEIALRAGVNILPIAIHHDGSYLRKGQRWLDFPRARVDFGLSVGPRFDLDHLPIERTNPRQARRQLTDLLHQHLSELLARPPA